MDVSERKRERDKAFATWADKFKIVNGKLVEATKAIEEIAEKWAEYEREKSEAA